MQPVWMTDKHRRTSARCAIEVLESVAPTQWRPLVPGKRITLSYLCPWEAQSMVPWQVASVLFRIMTETGQSLKVEYDVKDKELASKIARLAAKDFPLQPEVSALQDAGLLCGPLFWLELPPIDSLRTEVIPCATM